MNKDATNPIVSITSPTGGEYFDATAPDFIVEITDDNLDKMWYTLNGGVNIFFTVNGTIDQNNWTFVDPYLSITLANNSNLQLPLSIWDALEEGSFTIELFANDTAGNLNNLYTINLIKDVSAPVVDIVHPLANATYSTTAPEITVTIDDATLETTWYTIVGIGGTFEFEATLGTIVITIDQTTWNSLSEGEVTIIFYANDSLGRRSSDSIILKKNVPEVFDLVTFLLSPLGLIIIGSAIAIVVAIVVVVILVKRRGHHKTSDKEVRRIDSLWD